jgi:hypothetical protein
MKVVGGLVVVVIGVAIFFVLHGEYEASKHHYRMGR